MCFEIARSVFISIITLKMCIIYKLFKNITFGTIYPSIHIYCHVIYFSFFFHKQ